MGQGRPVSTAQIERLLDGLRHGMTRKAASGYAGMHHSTFYRMIDADATLATNVESAENEAEAAHTLIVAEAGPKNWQASAWWLERRKWRDYGRHDKVEMTVDLQAEIVRMTAGTELDPDILLAEAEAILAGKR